MEKSFNLDGHDATIELGAKLATGMLAVNVEQLLVFLTGTLGAGKTTLCQGALRALGHSGAVKSPTYTLVEPYSLVKMSVYHFDLYRLSDPEELEYMGIRDYFEGRALCFVEWPERGTGILPEPDLNIDIQVDGKGRKVKVVASTVRGEQVLAKL